MVKHHCSGTRLEVHALLAGSTAKLDIAAIGTDHDFDLDRSINALTRDALLANESSVTIVRIIKCQHNWTRYWKCCQNHQRSIQLRSNHIDTKATIMKNTAWKISEVHLVYGLVDFYIQTIPSSHAQGIPLPSLFITAGIFPSFSACMNS
ncbi:hypothetical protein MRB53_041176 [Persea americana]|nr:hypothetical protein MRB53_041176 [Persea americana]